MEYEVGVDESVTTAIVRAVSAVDGRQLRSLPPLSHVLNLIVREHASIAGKTLQEANEEGLVPSDVLVVQINRDEGTITPTGKTLIKESDFVTIHSRSGVTDETLEVFTGT